MSGWTRRGRATRAPRSPRIELGAHGVPHTIIADNAGGHYMQAGQVDLCIVGTDRVTANGDVANKIGTYLKALAAKDNDVPFYVALPSSTIDWTLANGRDIPIEERSPDELLKMTGRIPDGGRRDRRDRGAGFSPPPIPVSTSRRRVSSPVSSPNAALARRVPRPGPMSRSLFPQWRKLGSGIEELAYCSAGVFGGR